MTAKELIAILSDLPADTEVVVYSKVNDPLNPNYVGSLDSIKTWAINGSSVQLEIETGIGSPDTFHFRSIG